MGQKNARPQSIKDHSVFLPTLQLEDLPDDALLEVFLRISAIDLLVIQRVSRRWQWLATEALKTNVLRLVMELSFTDDYLNDVCRHRRSLNLYQQLSLDKLLHQSRFPKTANNSIINNYRMFVKLRKIAKQKDHEECAEISTIDKQFVNCLVKCPAIRCVDFNSTLKLVTGRVLLQVADLCPRLECLTIRFGSLISENEWIRFVDKVGNRLVRFKVNLTSNVEPDADQMLRLMIGKMKRMKMFDVECDRMTDDVVESIKRIQKHSDAEIRLRIRKANRSIDSLDSNYLSWIVFDNQKDRILIIVKN